MYIRKIGKSFDNTSCEYVVIGRLNEIVATFRVNPESGNIYNITFATMAYYEIQEIMKLCEAFTC